MTNKSMLPNWVIQIKLTNSLKDTICQILHWKKHSYNRLISIKEIDLISYQNRNTRPRWVQGGILANIYKINYANSPQSLLEGKNKGDTFKLVIWGQLYPNRKTKDIIRKANYKTMSVRKIAAVIFKKILAN